MCIYLDSEQCLADVVMDLDEDSDESITKTKTIRYVYKKLLL